MIPKHSPAAIIRLHLMMLFCFATMGCVGTKDAYSEAEGVYETAVVVAEHYYSLVREANRLKGLGLLSGDSLVKAQELVRNSSPIVVELTHAAEVYNGFRSAENEAELQDAIALASVQVARIVLMVSYAGKNEKLSE